MFDIFLLKNYSRYNILVFAAVYTRYLDWVIIVVLGMLVKIYYLYIVIVDLTEDQPRNSLSYKFF